MRWIPSIGGLPRSFWFLWLGALVNRLGGFVTPFLTLYLTQVRKIPVERAGLIVSLYGAGAIFAGPLGGALADRVGRRPTLTIATVAGAAAMLQLGVARSEWHIALSPLALGLFAESYRPPLQAMVADLVGGADRVRAFGLLYWAVNLGFAVAAVAAGLLARVSFGVLFVGDAATTLAFGAIVWWNVPETRAPQPRARAADDAGMLAPYADAVMLLFLLLSFALALVFQQCFTTLPVDMEAHGVSARAYGMLIAVNGLMIIVLQPLSVALVQRFRRSHVLAVGALANGIGFGLGAWAHDPRGYALMIAVFTVGEILMLPVGATVVADLAPADRRGAYQGAYQLSWSVSSLAAPALGALVLGRAGGRALWLGCLAMGGAIAVGQLALGPARRRRLAAMRAEAASVAE